MPNSVQQGKASERVMVCGLFGLMTQCAGRERVAPCLCVHLCFQSFHSGVCSVVQIEADLLLQAPTDVIQYMETSVKGQSVPIAS